MCGSKRLCKATSQPAVEAADMAIPLVCHLVAPCWMLPAISAILTEQPSSSQLPTSPKASDLAKYLPNATAEIIDGQQPISLVHLRSRKNKLPYTINYTLDIQWQPRNDLAVELGYVGNLGRHQVIPVPFNQPVIANAASPTLAGGPNQQIFTYGYDPRGLRLRSTPRRELLP